MVHPIYNRQQLETLEPRQVKAICVQLGIAPAFRKAACIELILNHQAAQVEVVETVETVTPVEPTAPVPATCATCPHFEAYNDKGRGICTLFDQVARSWQVQTQDCINTGKGEQPEDAQTVAQLELEQYLEEQSEAIAPEPVTPEGYAVSVIESDNFFRTFGVYHASKYIGRVYYSLTGMWWGHSKQRFNDNSRYTKHNVIAALASEYERHSRHATTRRSNQRVKAITNSL